MLNTYQQKEHNRNMHLTCWQGPAEEAPRASALGITLSLPCLRSGSAHETDEVPKEQLSIDQRLALLLNFGSSLEARNTSLF